MEYGPQPAAEVAGTIDKPVPPLAEAPGTENPGSAQAEAEDDPEAVVSAQRLPRLLAARRASAAWGNRALPWARHFPLVGMMAYYAFHFSQVTVGLLQAFDQSAYDMAIPDQGIWLLSRFHAPFVTVMGKDLFGDHTSFIFLFLVPLYWVYPHAADLLVLQAMSLALGALPVYLLARHLLRSTTLATALGAAYLLNPALQQGNLEQFHVEAFEAPILGFAVYALVTRRNRLLIVMVCLLLLCKQDDFLYVLPIGLVVVLRGQQRLGGLIIGAGTAVALVENLLVVPLLLSGIPTTYAGWVPFGGVSGFFETLIRRPGQFWAYFTSQGRPWYLWQMGFSTGLAAPFAPAILLIALPELAFDTLSDFGYQHQITRHYSMPLVAVLMCASAYAISRVPRGTWRSAATFGVALCALWSCVIWGAAPFSDSPAIAPPTNTQYVKDIRSLTKLIPPGAAVSAAYNYVPNLAHRPLIYIFPNPFSQSYYGNPKYDGTRLPAASKVQYILLPACVSCDGNLGAADQAVLNRVVGDFFVKQANPAAVLYQRK